MKFDKPCLFILASGSPRRTEILDKLGIRHMVMVSDVSEEHDEKTPDGVVRTLSQRKAYSVYEEFIKGSREAYEGYKTLCVIGSDTIVWAEGHELGKPSDREASRNMIKSISGKSHEVWSGLTLIMHDTLTGDRTEVCIADVTKVNVRELTEEEINEYVATGEGDDKAGSYAIQGLFGKYIESIEGDRDTVIGLPSARLLKELEVLL